MESLNLKKLLNRFLDWKITFILHCGKDLLTDLYKRFLKFKENVPKYGRTTHNSFLGTVGTICLRTYNLPKNFLIHWSIILTGYLLYLKILLWSSTFLWKFSSKSFVNLIAFSCKSSSLLKRFGLVPRFRKHRLNRS